MTDEDTAEKPSTAESQETNDAPSPTDSQEAPDLNTVVTHIDDDGTVEMVDIGDKPDTRRRAVARGKIQLRSSTVEAVRTSQTQKGNVLSTARIGAVQAVKHTWESIPLCHQIPITNVETAFELMETAIELTVVVETTGKTGCEMEALFGVSTGLTVIWDMVKSVEKAEDGTYPETCISEITLLDKTKQSIG